MSGTTDPLTLLEERRFRVETFDAPDLRVLATEEPPGLPIEERYTFSEGGIFHSDSFALEGLTVHLQGIHHAVNRFVTTTVLSDSGLIPMRESAWSCLSGRRQSEQETSFKSAVMSYCGKDGLWGSLTLRMPSGVAFVSQSLGTSGLKMTFLYGRIPETSEPSPEEMVICFNLVLAWLRTKHELLSGKRESRGIAINLDDFVERKWPAKTAAALIMGAWHCFQIRQRETPLKSCRIYTSDRESLLAVKAALLEYSDVSEGFSYYAVLDLLITRGNEEFLNDHGCALDQANRRLSAVSLVVGSPSPVKRSAAPYPAESPPFFK